MFVEARLLDRGMKNGYLRGNQLLRLLMMIHRSNPAALFSNKLASRMYRASISVDL